MKTVRVRIAVAVNGDGDWNATGLWSYSDEEAEEEARGILNGDDSPETVYFIEADVPIPEPQTIEGTVT